MPPTAFDELPGALRDTIIRDALHPASDLKAWNVTLTAPPASIGDFAIAMADYLEIVTERLPRGGALLCLDRGKSGLWHLHGILIAPAGFPERRRGPGPRIAKGRDPTIERARSRFIKWWTRLPFWMAISRGSIPIRFQQRVHAMPPPLDGALRRVLNERLRHHLKLSDDLPRPLPPLGERVMTAGILEPVWREVAARLGVPGVQPPDRPRPKPAPGRPRRRGRPPGSCGYCGRLATVDRHDTCRQSALRCLRRVEERFDRAWMRPLIGDWAAYFVENQAYYWADGLRLAEAAVRRGLVCPELEHPLVPRSVTRCRCGAPLPLNSKASTCGSSACRMAAKREAEEPRRSNTRTVVLEHDPTVWPERWYRLFIGRLEILDDMGPASTEQAASDVRRIFRWLNRRPRRPFADPPRLISSTRWREFLDTADLRGRLAPHARPSVARASVQFPRALRTPR